MAGTVERVCGCARGGGVACVGQCRAGCGCLSELICMKSVQAHSVVRHQSSFTTRRYALLPYRCTLCLPLTWPCPVPFRARCRAHTRCLPVLSADPHSRQRRARLHSGSGTCALSRRVCCLCICFPLYFSETWKRWRERARARERGRLSE